MYFFHKSLRTDNFQTLINRAVMRAKKVILPATTSACSVLSDTTEWIQQASLATPAVSSYFTFSMRATVIILMCADMSLLAVTV